LILLIFVDLQLVHCLFGIPIKSNGVNQKSSSSVYYFPRFGFGSNVFLSTRLSQGNEINIDELQKKKQQIKKNWMHLLQRSSTPRMVAFPSLIRSRRLLQ